MSTPTHATISSPTPSHSPSPCPACCVLCLLQAGQARMDVIFTEPTEVALGQQSRVVAPKRPYAVADLPVFEYAGLQGNAHQLGLAPWLVVHSAERRVVSPVCQTLPPWCWALMC